MTKEEMESIADDLAAFSHPVRLTALVMLCRRPHNVGEIVAELGSPQPLVSHHLGILRHRGIVATKQYGKAVCYSLADPKRVRAILKAAGIE